MCVCVCGGGGGGRGSAVHNDTLGDMNVLDGSVKQILK